MLFITLDNICYSNIKTFLSNSEWDIVMATTNLFKIVYKFTRFIKFQLCSSDPRLTFPSRDENLQTLSRVVH